MKRIALLAAALLAVAPALLAAQREKVIDVRASRPPAGNTFEALWAAYRKADAAGDREGADKVFKEIRRLRTERNIRSLELLAMALVSQGLDRLEKGDRERAAEDFANAIGLDPHLPDAYLARALAQVKKGPLGILPALKDVFAAITARLPTSRGLYYLFLLAVPVGLLATFAVITALALALVLRHGTLLLHDLEERFGMEEGRPLAMGVFALLLALPVVTFQGYGWLPLWWLALLFIYLSLVEKIVAALMLLTGLLVGPAVKTAEARILAERNPLFQAAMLAIEGGADVRAIAELERASEKQRDDHDLKYLLGIQYKKAGRYDDAAALYRDILRADSDDRVALNNLANIEFARGEFPAAIARYKQGAEQSPSPDFTATFYYNLSLAHLQRFEYQPAQEARSQAERFSAGLVRGYDNLWKYDKGDYAVVDLGLTQEEAWQKFAGMAEGVAVKNIAGRGARPLDKAKLVPQALNRFTGFLVVFGAVVFALSRWRGPRTFTMRCQKCGTPFCKHCHLGAVAAGLCTQCYHLFVVRDGVSGPARNQKLLEVQKEDARRERIFRVLSLLSPGSGHVYAHRPLPGMLFAMVWYGVLTLALLGGRLLPITEAPVQLSGRWGLGLAAALLLAIYVLANRARPDFEVVMPAPRAGARRTGRP